MNSYKSQFRDDTDILPFIGGGDCPVQYEVDFRADEYYIRYRHSWLTISKNDIGVFQQQLAHESADDGYWTVNDTTIYLKLISKAIKEDRLENLDLPSVFNNHHAINTPKESIGEYYQNIRQRQWDRMNEIYPIWAIALSSLLGGPMAAGYFLHENFVNFKEKQKANVSWWISVILAGVFSLCIIFLPERVLDYFPIIVVPSILFVVSYIIASMVQNVSIQSFKNFGGRNSSFGAIIGYSLFFGVITAILALFSILIRDSFFS